MKTRRNLLELATEIEPLAEAIAKFPKNLTTQVHIWDGQRHVPWGFDFHMEIDVGAIRKLLMKAKNNKSHVSRLGPIVVSVLNALPDRGGPQ